MAETQLVREAIADFMTETGCTQKQIADERGLSAGLVSQFMSGTYIGDNQKVVDTLNKYLSIAKERLNCCNTDYFLSTSGKYKDRLECCEICTQKM